MLKKYLYMLSSLYENKTYAFNIHVNINNIYNHIYHELSTGTGTGKFF